MRDLTVLVPFGRGGRQDWLHEAVASIPDGLPRLILENDRELADALNEGLRAAETEYVLRLDADDILDEQSVRWLHAAAWDVDVAYPKLVLVTEDLKVLGAHEPGEFCPHRLAVWNYIPGAGAVFRRQAALDVGGYREMDALEDWDLWLRMARNGARFKYHPDAKYFYRQVDGSRNKIGPERAAVLRDRIVGAEPPLKATFYAQETTATTYWRCLLPAKRLPAQVVLHRPVVEVEGEDIRFPHHRGAAVWQWPGNEYERYAMAAMQELGIRVLMETDDNYTVRIPYGKHWTRKMPDRGDPVPSIELHRRIVKWVDGVIVTTEHLARQYRKLTAAPVHVCPNQVEPDDWRHEHVPMPDWYDADATYVGVAGSASHSDDMKLVRQALEWASRQRGVEVVLMGLCPRSWVGKFPFRYVPWTGDISAYRALQRVLDIGLAPIVENPWSACRSDLKAMEYALSGACPVLSEATPYVGWEDGAGCRKAGTARDFLRLTQELVNTPRLRLELAAEARERTLRDRTVAANVWRWQEAIEGETEARAA
jgi:hypothetical protein